MIKITGDYKDGYLHFLGNKEGLSFEVDDENVVEIRLQLRYDDREVTTDFMLPVINKKARVFLAPTLKSYIYNHWKLPIMDFQKENIFYAPLLNIKINALGWIGREQTNEESISFCATLGTNVAIDKSSNSSVYPILLSKSKNKYIGSGGYLSYCFISNRNPISISFEGRTNIKVIPIKTKNLVKDLQLISVIVNAEEIDVREQLMSVFLNFADKKTSLGTVSFLENNIDVFDIAFQNEWGGVSIFTCNGKVTANDHFQRSTNIVGVDGVSQIVQNEILQNENWVVNTGSLLGDTYNEISDMQKAFHVFVKNSENNWVAAVLSGKNFKKYETDNSILSANLVLKKSNNDDISFGIF